MRAGLGQHHLPHQEAVHALGTNVIDTFSIASALLLFALVNTTLNEVPSDTTSHRVSQEKVRLVAGPGGSLETVDLSQVPLLWAQFMPLVFLTQLPLPGPHVTPAPGLQSGLIKLYEFLPWTSHAP